MYAPNRQTIPVNSIRMCSETSQKSAMLFMSQANLWIFQSPDTHVIMGASHG